MILVDAALLVAIVDSRDALHSTALKDLAALSPAGLRVCEAVAMEACFHLPHPHAAGAAPGGTGRAQYRLAADRRATYSLARRRRALVP